MRYLGILLAALLLWAVASCGGGGTSVDSPNDGAVVAGSYLDKPAGLNSLKGVSANGSGYVDLDVDYTWKLIGGQSIEVGYVRVTNDDTNIYVEYVITEDGWTIHQVHTYVGCEPPETGAPGQFPYIKDNFPAEGVTSYTETIPLSDLDCESFYKGCFYVATHAVVCIEGEDGEPYGGYTGGSSVSIYAGQNTEAGNLEVEVDGDNLLVTYNSTGGWEMSICQLYVGMDPPVPEPGNAPGQYPYKWPEYEEGDDLIWFTSHTFEIPLSDFGFTWGEDFCLYFAAHADMRLYTGIGDPPYEYETGWAIPDDGFNPFGPGWGGYFQLCFIYDEFGGDPSEGYCETAWGGPQYLGTSGKEKDKWQWGDYGWDKKWGGYFCAPYMPIFVPESTIMQGVFHPNGWTAYWKLWFNPDEYPWPDYEGNGNDWEGWCTDPTVMQNNTMYYPTFYSCYDPNLPSYANSDHWDLISWILNEHAKGVASEYYYPWDVTQRAIHYFKYGNGGGLPNGTASAGTNKSYDNSQAVRDLVAAAIANGEDYIPGPGEYYAVILWPGINPNTGTTYYQMNIIAVDP